MGKGADEDDMFQAEDIGEGDQRMAVLPFKGEGSEQHTHWLQINA